MVQVLQRLAMTLPHLSRSLFSSQGGGVHPSSQQALQSANIHPGGRVGQFCVQGAVGTLIFHFFERELRLCHVLGIELPLQRKRVLLRKLAQTRTAAGGCKVLYRSHLRSPNKQRRQNAFLEATKEMGRCTMHYGHYLEVPQQCGRCGYSQCLESCGFGFFASSRASIVR